MRFFKNTVILSASLLASACGTLAGGQTQEITLVTPGAYEAECTFENGNRYKVATGETIQVMRSNKDLKVDCYAAGNRHKVMTVPSTFNDWSAANVANGIVPGTAYDHFSKGLYEYPSVITVDFVGMPSRGFETPKFLDKDAPNPYEQAIEPYVPSTPKIPSDDTYLRRGVEKRNSNRDSNPFANMGAAVPSAPAAPVVQNMPVPKGSSAEELNRSMNPDVFEDKETK